MTSKYALAILGLGLWLLGCQPATQSVSNPTVEMIRLVNEANGRIDPMKVPYSFNGARAEHYLRMVQAATNSDERTSLRTMRGYELLAAGQNDRAILELEQLLKEVEGKNPEIDYAVKRLLALTYFRLGEQSNCIERPNTESCLFPISEKGVYSVRLATERAIRLFEEILLLRPGDYESVWMLNLAYMTLGRHPQDVPVKWLIPEKSFQTGEDFPPFREAAGPAGLRTLGLSGGAIVDDFNNDGLLDIFASSWGVNDQIHFFVNKGDGTFEDMAIEAGLGGVTGGLQITHADYDNDGWLDLLVLRGAWYGREGAIPNSLLRNNGDGTFTDVTIEAGLLSYHPTQTAVWADFNLDGWLDLFIGNESTMGTSDQPCEFYLSNGRDPVSGKVTFSNRVEEMGLSALRGMIKGASAADINNDGRPDLYVSFLDRPNILLYHAGIGPDGFVSWQDITENTGTGEPLNSFPCWFWDYDNDGWEDLFVSSFTVQGTPTAAHLTASYYLGLPVDNLPRVYRNLGNGKFENVAQQLGLSEPVFTMGSSFGDIDNDGFPDPYLGTGTPSFAALVPNKIYLNKGGKSFADVTGSSRLGHLQKGHGVAFGDIDNDGDEDIFTVMGGAYEGDVFANALFINTAGNEKPWLKVVLEGSVSNRAAIGARVIVNLTDPKGETRYLFRTVSPGGSFGGNSLELLFGMGDAVRVEEIKVIWPNRDRVIETFKPEGMNQKIKLVEGSGTVKVLEEKRFVL
jgi:hypothetical protein